MPPINNLDQITPGLSLWLDEIRGSRQRSGGIGPRLYDRLIGEAAVAHAIPRILTWNVGHMRGLFPNLVVTTPTDFVSGETRAR